MNFRSECFCISSLLLPSVCVSLSLCLSLSLSLFLSLSLSLSLSPSPSLSLLLFCYISHFFTFSPFRSFSLYLPLYLSLSLCLSISRYKIIISHARLKIMCVSNVNKSNTDLDKRKPKKINSYRNGTIG